MGTFFQKKSWVLLLAALALISLTVLSISLDELSFGEAQHFRSEDTGGRQPATIRSVAEVWEEVPLWQHILLWSLLAVMFILLGLLLSPEMRKRLFRNVIRVVLIGIVVIYALLNYQDTAMEIEASEGGGAPNSGLPSAALGPAFQPPEVSSTLSYVFSFLCALTFVVLVWGGYRLWKKYNALSSRKPLDEIAHIVRSSLSDLSAGRDSSDVIINCYLRMSQVVEDRRGLQREIAMTPQEFALRLERAGIPGDAVRRLTNLFEVVRYGDRRSAPRDVTEAVSCLNTILHYCGETI